MSSLLNDLRLTLRQLRHAPGFAVLAVVTLALAIGANTAMFTVAEDVLLRPLPYAHAERLISVNPDRPGSALTSSSWLLYRDIQAQAVHTLAGVGISSQDNAVVETDSATGGNASRSVAGPRMTPNLFSMLGVEPLLGRTFSAADAQPNGPAVVILSEGLWRDSFHADPAILGRTIRVNGQAHTVVGVMPASFHYPEVMGSQMSTALWLPLQPNPMMLDGYGLQFADLLAELRPGVSLAQAQAELTQTAKTVTREHASAFPSGLYLTPIPYLQTIVGQVRPVFLGLVAALGMVLLIACANVANLMIARSLGRQQEFAVRAALGAPRTRLVGQLLAEGGLLTFLGCACGIGLAALLLRGLRALPPDTLPRADSITLDWTVIFILAGIAAVSTLLSSILPAFLAARTQPQHALQSTSRGVGSRGVSGRLTHGLVIGEVALSTLLLVATGLLFHTLWNLQHADPGFVTARVTTFNAAPPDLAQIGAMASPTNAQQPESSIAITTYAPLLQRFREAPGVQSVALTSSPPFSGVNMGTSYKIVGVPKDIRNPLGARATGVSADYARVMGTPMLRGRMVSDSDTAAAPYVIVINQTLAVKAFGDRDPIGRQIDLGGKKIDMEKPYTIVGVIADQKDTSMSAAPQPLLLLPFQQIPVNSVFYQALLKTQLSFVVKTRGHVAVAPLARSVFASLAPGYALENFATLQETVDKSNFGNRLGLCITGAFAGLASLMVITGLYGVLAQLVGYRRREIGIRLALGAPRASVLQMILRQGAGMVVTGLVVGLAISLFTGRLLHGFLYGIGTSDGWTYAGVLVSLSLIGAAASYIPAWRASSIPPVEALRDE